MTEDEIILTVIGAVLSSSVLNGILTHILYKNKLKKELKIKGHEMMANEIDKSLQSVRSMELKLTVQEIYDVQNVIEQRKSQVNLFEGEAIYLEIFNDWKTYNGFKEVIAECRRKYERNLSVKTALNLVFIDRYIQQLSLFLAEHGGEDMMPFWGTVFIFDLQKWQKRMDKLLIKEINQYTYKLESHETIKWKIMRKKELIWQYENTILFYLINNKCKRKNRKKMEYIKEMLHEML